MMVEDSGRGYRQGGAVPTAPSYRRVSGSENPGGRRLRGDRGRWRGHTGGWRMSRDVYRGVEAVIDKDLASALLAAS